MEKMVFYVYEVKGEIVGVAAIHPVPNEGVGIVRWVYAHPKHQRRGVGTSLMKCVEEEGRKMGLKKLRLVVHEKAFWAIKFYEKLGFKIVARVDRAAWRDNVMEKTL